MRGSLPLLFLVLSCAVGCAPVARGPVPPPVEPPAPGVLEEAIRRGVDFLLEAQNPNGSWGSARRTKDLNIYAPVPGAHHAFRAAVTSLSISALIESGIDSPAVRAALKRAEEWMFEHLPRLRRATPDTLYNIWGHAYALQALVRMCRREEDPARLDLFSELIASQLDLLRRYEFLKGGWSYYNFYVQTQKPSGSPSSFTTATVLVALHEASQLGFEVPRGLVTRALDAIHLQRKPDFSYLYGEYFQWAPMRAINLPAGSLGRSQVCNLALRLWGEEVVTEEVLKTWLNRLFARNDWLVMGRKRPIPHESFFAVSGYFFCYGHYYAALCIDLLREEERPWFQDHLAHALLPLQEKDGSWWDYPFYDYHQPYGTAYIVMALVRCRRPLATDRPLSQVEGASKVCYTLIKGDLAVPGARDRERE